VFAGGFCELSASGNYGVLVMRCQRLNLLHEFGGKRGGAAAECRPHELAQKRRVVDRIRHSRRSSELGQQRRGLLLGAGAGERPRRCREDASEARRATSP
jgi:hypothetical protein